MFCQLGSLLEASRASIAFEGLCSRVDSQVVLQVASLVELSMADAADHD